MIKDSKIIKALSRTGVVITLIFILTTVVVNTNIKEVLSEKDSTLALEEHIKRMVSHDLYLYLSVRDKESYEYAKKNFRGHKDLIYKLFGSSYSTDLNPIYDDVRVADVRYTIDKSSELNLHALVYLKRGSEVKEVNFLVFLEGGRIFDIVAY